MSSIKIILGDMIGQNRFILAKFIDEDCLGIWTCASPQRTNRMLQYSPHYMNDKMKVYKSLRMSFLLLTIHTVHRVIDHGKVLPVKEGLDGIKVEDSLKKFHM